VRKRFARVAMDADRRLTFDGFSLDLANEQLVCDGEVVALTPKAFAVLRRLIEDACTAADMLVTIHVERNDLPTARTWLERAELWAQQVGAQYSRNSLNAERAIMALTTGAPGDAAEFVQMDVDRVLRDPLVRQRVMNLAILARLLVALRRNDALERILEGLRDGLARIRNTPRHDYFVASVGLTLGALGRRREAIDYVRRYVAHSRTNRCDLSAEMAAMCCE
jgi:hypothetical protein